MRFLVALFCTATLLLPAAARAQQAQVQPVQSHQPQPQQAQAQLDSLLAPIALYPDDVVRLVVDAATVPNEVAEAAQWSRNNRGMTAEDSVNAVQGYTWRPSVKALVAYPDLLDRMAESPQWTSDLGNAWIGQQAEVLATIQQLRQRAQASGTLQSNQYQTVEQTDQGIAVAPAMPYIYYVPYYDPLVVYGGWWWPAYQPVFWRPWYARPVFVTRVALVNRVYLHAPGRVFVTPHGTVSPAVRFQQQQSAQFIARQQAAARPSAAVRMQNQQFRQGMAPSSFHPTFRPSAPPVHVQPYQHAPATYRAPMMQSRAGPALAASHAMPRSSGGGAHGGGGWHGGGGSHSGGGGRGRS
jgi:uncharacterized membrane protein YgcG